MIEPVETIDKPYTRKGKQYPYDTDLLLRYLKKHGELSNKEIYEATGLSCQKIASIAYEFFYLFNRRREGRTFYYSTKELP